MNRRSCGAVHPGGGPSGPIGDGEALMEAWLGTPFVEMDSCSAVEWSGGALAGDWRSASEPTAGISLAKAMGSARGDGGWSGRAPGASGAAVSGVEGWRT
jgi:hypothetical protein